MMLENGASVVASVPAGKSRSSFEAVELRDENRMMGMGVSKAVENLQTIIAPLIINKEPDLQTMDLLMIERDGTPDKSKIGANAILAASMAICKAQALAQEQMTYEFIANLAGEQTVAIPFPMINIINGGVHANNHLMIQEFLIIPVGAANFAQAFESALLISAQLKEILLRNKKWIGVGDEGGFTANFDDEQEALDMLMEAIETAGFDEESVLLGLDVAATQMYDPKKKKYFWRDKPMTTKQLIEVYEVIIANYPIYSIEDGMAETDDKGWKAMAEAIGSSCYLVGDDIFATNAERIAEHAQADGIASVVIKPNQVGTVTEAINSIMLCKQLGLNTVASHRSGETNDTFIVDLAVGTSAGFIKAGGCSRGERMAKYNYLIRIEDELMLGMLGA
jgi:enolase